MEGGPPIFRQDCTCPALLEDMSSGFPYGAVTRCGSPFQTLPVPQTHATGLFRVRSPLLTESRLMSVPPATEMFQFAGFASPPYEFRRRYPGSSPGWVAPFGDPGITDRSHLPRAFRSVPRPSSPLSAKASTRCPSLALDCHHAARAQGQNPIPKRPRMKTLLGHTPRARAWRVRLGHMTTPSSPFNQHPAPAELGPARSAPHLTPRQTPVLAGSLMQRLSRGRKPRCGRGGGERIRTDDLLLAKQALSQLSYTPLWH